MATLDGKVAFITGAARGQGRAHAVRLAEEGADIIGIDICEQMSAAGYAMGTQDELDQTVKEVEALGRKMVGIKADVREYAEVRAAYKQGVAELGAVTIVIANAGIGPGSPTVAQETAWDEVIGVNLTGVWNTGRATIQNMIRNGQGGSVILTSSTGGLMSPGVNDAGMLSYVAAKHGVIGLMRAWANYGAPHSIRVNCLAPTTVRTPMAGGGSLADITQYAPHLLNSLTNAMPVEAVDPVDVANAVAFLASDAARYITGTVLPVDAGNIVRR
ncbi:MAG TPA: mycofactocin-coupled SDR family oxidoreductase [Mycobacteriales bacterium]|jgi:SDR family mycofactocin-dependent oxidoreductase|nr:mycofactocin-coupled SDR family oxidoreductase [Mycobacteriales bacterium]